MTKQTNRKNQTDKTNTILLAIGATLAAAGLILIMITVFNEDAPQIVLSIGLLCTAFGSIVNVFRLRRDQKGKKEE